MLCLEEAAMNPDELYRRYQELQRYVGWTETDTRQVQSVAGMLEPYLTPLIDDFYAEIDPKESKISHSGRDVSLVLRKKELKEEYWPRLLKDSKKMHFLKTNFDKVSLGASTSTMCIY